MPNPIKTPELLSFVIENKNKEKSWIIQEVKDKFGKNISKDNIYDWTTRNIDITDKVEALNKEDVPKYTIDKDDYIIGPYRLSIEEIDSMFKDFSEYGTNLSGQQMRRKYNLTPKAWNTIKHSLSLYKTSHVLSPFTAENITEDKLEEKIDEAIHSHIDNMGSKFTKTYDKRFKETAKQNLDFRYNTDYYLECLQEYIKDYEPTELIIRTPRKYNSKEIVVAFSDIHIGKQNTQDVISRIYAIGEYCKSLEEDTINMICLGDLGESFAPGGMHPGQENKMEYYGFDLMMKIVQVIEGMLIDVSQTKRINFHGICGNHDRIGKHHDEDTQRTAGLVIYELIKRGISNYEIGFYYHVEKINTLNIGKLHFIYAHGDNGFDKRKSEDILWKNGEYGKYNVVLMGDKHNAWLTETKNGCMVRLPCIAGKGEYDTILDLHSEPGFCVIRENEKGTADLLFKRL